MQYLLGEVIPGDTVPLLIPLNSMTLEPIIDFDVGEPLVVGSKAWITEQVVNHSRFGHEWWRKKR